MYPNRNKIEITGCGWNVPGSYGDRSTTTEVGPWRQSGNSEYGSWYGDGLRFVGRNGGWFSRDSIGYAEAGLSGMFVYYSNQGSGSS